MFRQESGIHATYALKKCNPLNVSSISARH